MARCSRSGERSFPISERSGPNREPVSSMRWQSRHLLASTSALPLAGSPPAVALAALWRGRLCAPSGIAASTRTHASNGRDHDVIDFPGALVSVARLDRVEPFVPKFMLEKPDGGRQIPPRVHARVHAPGGHREHRLEAGVQLFLI